MTGASTPPAIVRPIPRRPFNLNLTSATPPSNSSSPSELPHSRNAASPSGQIASFLDPHPRSPLQSTDAPDDGDTETSSISRTQSILNLTQSALFGIYSPTFTDRGKGYASSDADRIDPGTPWGTGAQTPAYLSSLHRSTIEEEDDPERAEALEELRERLGVASKSHNGGMLTGPMSPTAPQPYESAPSVQKQQKHQQQDQNQQQQQQHHHIGSGDMLALAAKAALLFVLGASYGMVVYRLRDEHMSTSLQQHHQRHASSFFPAKGSYDKWHVAFWGVSGVILGSLLPWFDQFCDRTLGPSARVSCSPSDETEDPKDGNSILDTDWPLVIRGIGCFAGIVLAIRKLPWDSTMQVSLTLALVNPFLWYLIDRSKSGFMLASAVGVVGAALITSLDPEMMPTPTFYDSRAAAALSKGSDASRLGQGQMALGGLTRRATLEAAIWILSVLFCSCVCFGNIGRRLALSTSTPDRGRWGGIR